MNYENEKNSIIDIIGNQTSISKDQAYPKFQSLAKMYTKFQEQVFILDIRENVFRKLIEFVSKEDGIKQDYDPEEWEGCFEVDVEKLDAIKHDCRDFIDLEVAEKIDMYDQVMNNWQLVLDYVWNNLEKANLKVNY